MSFVDGQLTCAVYESRRRTVQWALQIAAQRQSLWQSPSVNDVMAEYDCRRRTVEFAMTAAVEREKRYQAMQTVPSNAAPDTIEASLLRLIENILEKCATEATVVIPNAVTSCMDCVEAEAQLLRAIAPLSCGVAFRNQAAERWVARMYEASGLASRGVANHRMRCRMELRAALAKAIGKQLRDAVPKMKRSRGVEIGPKPIRPRSDCKLGRAEQGCWAAAGCFAFLGCSAGCAKLGVVAGCTAVAAQAASYCRSRMRSFASWLNDRNTQAWDSALTVSADPCDFDSASLQSGDPSPVQKASMGAVCLFDEQKAMAQADCLVQKLDADTATGSAIMSAVPDAGCPSSRATSDASPTTSSFFLASSSSSFSSASASSFAPTLLSEHPGVLQTAPVSPKESQQLNSPQKAVELPEETPTPTSERAPGGTVCLDISNEDLAHLNDLLKEYMWNNIFAGGCIGVLHTSIEPTIRWLLEDSIEYDGEAIVPVVFNLEFPATCLKLQGWRQHIEMPLPSLEFALHVDIGIESVVPRVSRARILVSDSSIDLFMNTFAHALATADLRELDERLAAEYTETVTIVAKGLGVSWPSPHTPTLVADEVWCRLGFPCGFQ